MTDSIKPGLSRRAVTEIHNRKAILEEMRAAIALAAERGLAPPVDVDYPTAAMIGLAG